MKIRSVDVLLDEVGDGTESTSSDTLDSSSSAGCPPVQQTSGKHHRKSAATTMATKTAAAAATAAATHEYEKTIGQFAVAMTELHAELRDKTNECEALYETAHNLSSALQESDRLLQEKTLECERLLLKLQMVTFVDFGSFETEREDDLSLLDESYYDEKVDSDNVDEYTIPQRPAAILDTIAQKYGGKKVMAKPRPEVLIKSTRSKGAAAQASTDASGALSSRSSRSSSSNSATTASPLPLTRREPSVPVCVDDQEDPDPASADGSNSDSSDDISEENLPRLVVDRNAVLSAGPRQAHFYHVIVERDLAVQTNKKMSRELKYTRAKIRDLKAKLERSTALVELSYATTASDTIASPPSKHKEKQCSSPKNQPCSKLEHEDAKESRPELALKKVSKAAKPQPLTLQEQQLLPLLPKCLDEDTATVKTTTRSRRSSMPWLRKNGLSVRQHQPLNESIAQQYISDDEMISSHWNKTDDKLVVAAAEEKYLRAVTTASDDADRAGGGTHPVSVLMDI